MRARSYTFPVSLSYQAAQVVEVRILLFFPASRHWAPAQHIHSGRQAGYEGVAFIHVPTQLGIRRNCFACLTCLPLLQCSHFACLVLTRLEEGKRREGAAAGEVEVEVHLRLPLLLPFTFNC